MSMLWSPRGCAVYSGVFNEPQSGDTTRYRSNPEYGVSARGQPYIAVLNQTANMIVDTVQVYIQQVELSHRGAARNKL